MNAPKKRRRKKSEGGITRGYCWWVYAMALGLKLVEAAHCRLCGHWHPGDRLWVRETWRSGIEWDDTKPGEIDPLVCSDVWYEASRADWLKELKDPSKAESVARYCDRWWLVVANKDIVKAGELPPLWGLMTLQGDALRVVTEAKSLKPVPMDRVFLAALMRACAKPAARDNKDALQKEYWKGQEASRQYSEPKIKRLEDELARVRAEIHQFEQAAGFRLNQGWKGTAHAGQVVRDVLAGKHDRDHDDIRHIRELAQGIVERADAELAKESEVAR